MLALADEQFTVPELHRMLGRSEEGIRRVLVRLVDQGVVERTVIGGSRAYRLNGDHLAAEAIRALADQRNLLVRRIGRVVEGWAQAVVWVAVFGSVGRGSGRRDSDVDLLVVHDGDDDDDLDAEVQALAEAISRWTGNDARPLVLAADELRAVEAPAVVVEAMRDGVTVAGSRETLRRLVRSNGRNDG